MNDFARGPAGNIYDCPRWIYDDDGFWRETTLQTGGGAPLKARGGTREVVAELFWSSGIVCNGNTENDGKESQSDESDELHDGRNW